jgi:hypothetical protein
MTKFHVNLPNPPGRDVCGTDPAFESLLRLIVLGSGVT